MLSELANFPERSIELLHQVFVKRCLVAIGFHWASPFWYQRLPDIFYIIPNSVSILSSQKSGLARPQFLEGTFPKYFHQEVQFK